MECELPVQDLVKPKKLRGCFLQYLCNPELSGFRYAPGLQRFTTHAVSELTFTFNDEYTGAARRHTTG
jgi:hypothetical protein